jgi:GDP-mannose transporter
MTFLLLSMQSIVCVACVIAAKKSGVISFRNFDIQDAKAWYPISCLLVSVIYTGSKSLVSTAEQESQYVRHALTASPQQYLSIPVYTIFKNLTIILIVRLLFSVVNVWRLTRNQAYGEVLWFGGRITALTMVAFIFMASGLMVIQMDGLIL